MAVFREFTGYAPLSYFQEVRFPTSNQVEVELWTLLKMPHKVTNGRINVASLHGIKDKKTQLHVLKNKYRGYIIQAENYWNAAKLADYKSSPLLYYYCFLNLLKAFLVLNEPTLPEQINHGLSLKISNLNKQFLNNVLDKQDGAFSRYYKLVFDKNPPNKIVAKDLISYMQDMSFQVAQGRYAKPLARGFKHRLVTKDKDCWVVFLIPKDAELNKYKTYFRDFFRTYENVDVPSSHNQFTSVALGINPIDWRDYEVFQSKSVSETATTNVNNLTLNEESKFNNRLSLSTYKSDETAVINLPLNTAPDKVLNEEICIYAFMFMLSSLVRYSPDYIQKTDNTKYGWLIESFVNTAPTRYLHYMVSRIYGINIKIDTV